MKVSFQLNLEVKDKVLKKYQTKSIGIELFGESKISKLSTVSAQNVLGSNNEYDASTSAKLKLRTVSNFRKAFCQ